MKHHIIGHNPVRDVPAPTPAAKERPCTAAPSFALPWQPSVAPAFRTASATTTADWHRFEVTTRVTLPDTEGPAELWLPLAQTAAGYQTAEALTCTGTAHTEVTRDTLYGAPILHAARDAARTPRHIETTQTIAIRDRGSIPLTPLTEAERQFWTASNETIPTDGIVRDTAETITDGHATPKDRLRALYDRVVDTTWRDPATPGCGTGDIVPYFKRNVSVANAPTSTA